MWQKVVVAPVPVITRTCQTMSEKKSRLGKLGQHDPKREKNPYASTGRAVRLGGVFSFSTHIPRAQSRRKCPMLGIVDEDVRQRGASRAHDCNCSQPGLLHCMPAGDGNYIRGCIRSNGANWERKETGGYFRFTSNPTPPILEHEDPGERSEWWLRR